jgi:hypothetical protein
MVLKLIHMFTLKNDMTVTGASTACISDDL